MREIPVCFILNTISTKYKAQGNFTFFHALNINCIVFRSFVFSINTINCSTLCFLRQNKFAQARSPLLTDYFYLLQVTFPLFGGAPRGQQVRQQRSTCSTAHLPKRSTSTTTEVYLFNSDNRGLLVRQSQCRVYRVQGRGYRVQCRVYRVQCRVYRVQCRVFRV